MIYFFSILLWIDLTSFLLEFWSLWKTREMPRFEYCFWFDLTIFSMKNKNIAVSRAFHLGSIQLLCWKMCHMKTYKASWNSYTTARSQLTKSVLVPSCARRKRFESRVSLKRPQGLPSNLLLRPMLQPLLRPLLQQLEGNILNIFWVDFSLYIEFWSFLG